MIVPLLIAAKAEVLLGTLLTARNRAVRLVCILAMTLGGVLSVQDVERIPAAHRPLTVFLIAGTLAAVAGARLFAPGGALAALRQVGAAWWLAPVGRLTGALLVVMPVVAVAVVAIKVVGADPLLLGASVTIYAAAVASFSFSLAIFVGSSTAVTATLVLVWVGAVPAAAPNTWFEQWTVVRAAWSVFWNTVPLPWRAGQLLRVGSPVDALVLAGWVVAGILLVGWASTAARPLFRANGGGR